MNDLTVNGHDTTELDPDLSDRFFERRTAQQFNIIINKGLILNIIYFFINLINDMERFKKIEASNNEYNNICTATFEAYSRETS